MSRDEQTFGKFSLGRFANFVSMEFHVTSWMTCFGIYQLPYLDIIAYIYCSVHVWLGHILNRFKKLVLKLLQNFIKFAQKFAKKYRWINWVWSNCKCTVKLIYQTKRLRRMQISCLNSDQNSKSDNSTKFIKGSFKSGALLTDCPLQFHWCSIRH